MPKNRLLNILTIVCLLFFVACAKTGPTGPTGPAGPSYTGNISGHLSLYDKYGSPILSGFSSASLALSSTTATLTNNVPIHPDNSGYYLFKDIKTGSYSIAVTDSGYAATIVGNIPFVVGTLNQDIKLSAIPDSFIKSFTADTGIAGDYDSLTIYTGQEIKGRNCVVFVNSNATVSNANSAHLLTYVIPIDPYIVRTTFLIPRSDMLNAGIAVGQKIYFAAYSYVVNDRSVYVDFASGKSVYNAVNSNPIIDSAIVP